MKYIETAIKNILISLWTSLSGQCQRLHLTINPPRKVNGDSQRMGECLGAHFVPFCPYLFRGLGGSWSGSYCRCFFVCSVWWGSKGTVCSLLLCDLPCLFICTHTHTCSQNLFFLLWPLFISLFTIVALKCVLVLLVWPLRVHMHKHTPFKRNESSFSVYLL